MNPALLPWASLHGWILVGMRPRLERTVRRNTEERQVRHRSDQRGRDRVDIYGGRGGGHAHRADADGPGRPEADDADADALLHRRMDHADMCGLAGPALRDR